jgi:hypothetical protein
VLHVPADPVSGRNIAAIIDLPAGEVGLRDPGARAPPARLIDLPLIAAIRRWAEERPKNRPPSWLMALRDPIVGHVLALLHDRPGDP